MRFSVVHIFALFFINLVNSANTFNENEIVKSVVSSNFAPSVSKPAFQSYYKGEELDNAKPKRKKSKSKKCKWKPKRKTTKRPNGNNMEGWEINGSSQVNFGKRPSFGESIGFEIAENQHKHKHHHNHHHHGDNSEETITITIGKKDKPKPMKENFFFGTVNHGGSQSRPVFEESNGGMFWGSLNRPGTIIKPNKPSSITFTVETNKKDKVINNPQFTQQGTNIVFGNTQPGKITITQSQQPSSFFGNVNFKPQGLTEIQDRFLNTNSFGNVGGMMNGMKPSDMFRLNTTFVSKPQVINWSSTGTNFNPPLNQNVNGSPVSWTNVQVNPVTSKPPVNVNPQNVNNSPVNWTPVQINPVTSKPSSISYTPVNVNVKPSVNWTPVQVNPVTSKPSSISYTPVNVNVKPPVNWTPVQVNPVNSKPSSISYTPVNVNVKPPVNWTPVQVNPVNSKPSSISYTPVNVNANSPVNWTPVNLNSGNKPASNGNQFNWLSPGSNNIAQKPVNNFFSSNPSTMNSNNGNWGSFGSNQPQQTFNWQNYG